MTDPFAVVILAAAIILPAFDLVVFGFLIAVNYLRPSPAARERLFVACCASFVGFLTAIVLYNAPLGRPLPTDTVRVFVLLIVLIASLPALNWLRMLFTGAFGGDS